MQNNNDLEQEFIDLVDDWLEEWENLAQPRKDGKLFYKQIFDWTNKQDIALAKILVNIIRDNSEIFPSLSEENLPNIKEIIKEKLTQNPEIKNQFKERLEELKQKIINNNNYSPRELLDLLEKIWNSTEPIREEDENHSLVEELLNIGLIKKDSKGKLIPFSWIYQDLFDLKEIPTVRGTDSSPPNPLDGTSLPPPPPHQKGLSRPLSLTIFIGIIFLMFYGCVKSIFFPDRSIQPTVSLCKDFKNRVFNTGLIEDRNELRDERDKIIQQIADSLNLHSKKSLQELCDDKDLEIKFAEVLYTQASRLAEEKIYVGNSSLPSGKYGAVRSLCLISQTALDLDPELKKKVINLMSGWRTIETVKKQVEAEIELIQQEKGRVNLSRCPADQP
ncbi:hypothetical protein [Gloeothece verrucosa]|uniref:Uncharacterized protein n=1 Tax=Gloeothece verrucosa (strain PCC 7822) TaxID=497965 RepID=E0U9K1_GLOV7|nr:hypothetical protein [Gloeothece verrucosa]ADN13802.1 hypothetical protein Cyan7822_1816 [Gloeothece verrucosa PCC 7822]